MGVVSSSMPTPSHKAVLSNYRAHACIFNTQHAHKRQLHMLCQGSDMICIAMMRLQSNGCMRQQKGSPVQQPGSKQAGGETGAAERARIWARAEVQSEGIGIQQHNWPRCSFIWYKTLFPSPNIELYCFCEKSPLGKFKCSRCHVYLGWFDRILFKSRVILSDFSSYVVAVIGPLISYILQPFPSTLLIKCLWRPLTKLKFCTHTQAHTLLPGNVTLTHWKCCFPVR